jgi:MoxR-like ATPase
LGPQGSRWSAFERPWLVPDAMRTRYFTGREDLLALLRRQLLEHRRAALSGLGGVGKTQAAIEYAVRHRADLLFLIAGKLDFSSLNPNLKSR